MIWLEYYLLIGLEFSLFLLSERRNEQKTESLAHPIFFIIGWPLIAIAFILLSIEEKCRETKEYKLIRLALTRYRKFLWSK